MIIHVFPFCHVYRRILELLGKSINIEPCWRLWRMFQKMELMMRKRRVKRVESYYVIYMFEASTEKYVTDKQQSREKTTTSRSSNGLHLLTQL